MSSIKQRALDFIESLQEQASEEDIIRGLQSLFFKERFGRLSREDQNLIAELVHRLAAQNK